MSSVTSQQMIDAVPDDSSDSDFFNSSLSIWRGPKSSLEGSEDPVHLDLHTASSIGNYDVVRMYINSEADLNAKNSGGYTPLMYAAYIGHDNIINLLLDAQVDVNLCNNKGLTPLMLAASCGNESGCYFLKHAGANIEAKDQKGWTALFHATVNGHQNIVKFLLECGANIDAVEPKYGFTPLMQAAFQGHEIIVQTLLQYRANRHLTSRTGETAQSLALKKGNMKIVSLLQSKTQPNTRTSASYGGSDNGSSGDRSDTKLARSTKKSLSIKEGPDALSKIMSPQGPKGSVTFKEPPVSQKTKEMVAPVTPISTHPAVKVMQVSPTPKGASEKPADIHELLQQLGLLKYEQIFIEQDIDLEVFLTLSADDLKEIGIATFGPRRKMTNAIESWHKEHGSPSAGRSEDLAKLHALNEQLQFELKEKTWRLNEAYSQLAGYHSNLEYYLKEMENEKNIRALTESYLLAEKSRIADLLVQCKDTKAHCSKALKGQGKTKNICQLLRGRYEDNLEYGSLPNSLQESVKTADEQTKTQLTALANTSTKELWEVLYQGMGDASTSTAMAIFNLDKISKLCAEEK